MFDGFGKSDSVYIEDWRVVAYASESIRRVKGGRWFDGGVNGGRRIGRCLKAMGRPWPRRAIRYMFVWYGGRRAPGGCIDGDVRRRSGRSRWDGWSVGYDGGHLIG